MVLQTYADQLWRCLLWSAARFLPPGTISFPKTRKTYQKALPQFLQAKSGVFFLLISFCIRNKDGQAFVYSQSGCFLSHEDLPKLRRLLSQCFDFPGAKHWAYEISVHEDACSWSISLSMFPVIRWSQKDYRHWVEHKWNCRDRNNWITLKCNFHDWNLKRNSTWKITRKYRNTHNQTKIEQTFAIKKEL